MIYNNVSEAIGHTPVIKLDQTSEDVASIYVKLESRNPGGSVKDRPVKYILQSLIDSGEIEEGGAIVESTSGNTGIALAMLGAALKLRVIIVMPETMSIERRNLMKAYGAELILTPGAEGMKGAGAKAEEIAKEIGAPVFGQFVREANVQAHVETTAREILEDLPEIDGFVAGIGTGGTVTGVGRVLKEEKADAKVWGVEPEASPLLTEGTAGSHKIQGLGANFIPKILDQSVIDYIDKVSNEDAIAGAVELAHKYGILAGFSSGANYVSAQRLAKELGPDHHVLTVLPDTGERYLSSGAYSNED
ncbi:cysteine synthase A [Aerococcus sanguinicola]|uniref:cysteine synthase A n=1 Tax=unclassified Aerococcus TaxID=2618060 RepID=UPI0008A42659|nr:MULTISPECIES: cysteine synthase A [unclassified Aerococcus]MDK6232813.1 cysteine synthase A [Aerococcus sp. UMB10185]MDK6854896.1 cysteine synthase A [Aerococcus sp. UMB7533]MDK8501837.1 cysteine synthase A [Aerococcus sp. UMB1112A]OFN02657.1 cysteine synthase A [Aerococcus sp. HMSC062A02]OHO45420.1 cysteine synthase A [Aerococcus sp. HMSC035B07]